MCKHCQKLMELFAETQLKYGDQIKQVIIGYCENCGDKFFIVAKIEKDNIILSDNKGE